MHPICYELRIAVGDAQKEALIDLLGDLGETNFVEGALDFDVEFDYDYEHLAHDYYADLVHNVPLILYSEDLSHLEALKANIEAQAPLRDIRLPESAFALAPLADQNWRESWKASFKPIDVNGIFCILPPWEDKTTFAQPHKIVIDPGMAFGTGQHETTRLCLDIFLRLPTPARVFDVGMGSGILAIAANMRGSTDVLGCDIDPVCVDIAVENATINEVKHCRFTATPIDAIAEKDFDLVFANIQIKPLLRIFPDICARTSANGHIIISGILESERQEFLEALARFEVDVLSVEQLGHWLGILCRLKQR